jgi:hypothetical protein
VIILWKGEILEQLKLSEEMPEIKAPPKKKYQSKYQKFKAENHYRKGSLNPRKMCFFCKNLITLDQHHGRKHHKCTMLGLSSSSATDIRLSYICDQYEEA